MYFFSEDERKYILKKLLPEARKNDVSEDLRGWNWHQSELSPPFESIKLSLWEIAGKYCESGRDVYLRHVEKVTAPPNREMIRGKIYHDVLHELLPLAKKYIYQNGLNACATLREFLQAQKPTAEVPAQFLDEEKAEIQEYVSRLWNFEVNRICSRVDEYLGKYYHLNEDSLVNHAMPIVLEHKMDGRYLGLSGNLSADAVNFAGVLICDLKTGAKRDFHRLTTAGYSLVYESLYEIPVNIGCTVYLSFIKGHPTPHIERDIYLINDELRQWFIEERDNKLEVVYYGKDPGKAKSCPQNCIYVERCA